MLNQLVPPWARWVGGISAAFWIGHSLFTYGKAVEVKNCALRESQAQTSTVTATLKDEHGQRAEEQRRTTERQRINDEDAKDLEGRRQRADALLSDAQRLHDQAARLVSQARRAGPNPAAVSASTPTESLGSAFGSCVTEYRAVVTDLEASRAAGQRCEREYDALTPDQSPASDKGSDQ